MDETILPEMNLQNLSPEVVSYIYQVIGEFEQFVTPETKVSVVAKDPLSLLSQDDEVNASLGYDKLPKKSKIKVMHRIAITLSEDGGTLMAEGLHENIFEAIKIAKDKLLVILNGIQDDLISSSERHLQIKHALSAGGEVH